MWVRITAVPLQRARNISKKKQQHLGFCRIAKMRTDLYDILPPISHTFQYVRNTDYMGTSPWTEWTLQYKVQAVAYCSMTLCVGQKRLV